MMKREGSAPTPRPQWPKWMALLAAGLLVVGSWGCYEEVFGLRGQQRGPVRLGRGRLVIFPFATPNRKPFESEVGKAFARGLAQLVRQGCPEATVADPDDLPEAIEGRRIDEFPILALAKLLKADYVVWGEIHDLRAKDPLSFNVLKGTMVVSARVLSTKQGGVVWQINRQKHHYPRLIVGESVPADGMDEEQVIQGVMREAAWGIAVAFRPPRTYEEERLGR